MRSSIEYLGPSHHASACEQAYREFVGFSQLYDTLGALQFNLLTFLGLREHHYLLDVGCGSLRAGRLFISYLLPNHYSGIEPNEWLVKEAIEQELGRDVNEIKKPRFSETSDFDLSVFDQKFDFILAHSIFSHASARQISNCLSEAGKVMHNHSIFAATFIDGAENYSGKEWRYPQGVTYTLPFIKNLCIQHQLTCSTFDWYHPTQRWIILKTLDNTDTLPQLTDIQRLVYLEEKSKYLQDELNRLKKHPVYKLKRFVRNLLRKMN